MAQRTAEDVANMETELHDLRALLEDMRQRLVIADTERKTLKIENALLKRKSDDNLEKATRMETIMSQVSAGLVAGLMQMKEERDVARALRRGEQEDYLGVGGADSATFLTRGTNRTRTTELVPSETRTEHDQDDTSGRDEVDAEREIDTDRDRGRPELEGVRPTRLLSPKGEAPRQNPTTRDMNIRDQERADKLAGAVEQVAQAPTFLRQGRVDPRIADRDDRMPRNEFGGQHARDLDEENLRNLANNMNK